MKLVTFNVNSVRMRPHQLELLIEKHNPGVIGLQETKVQDHEFPVEMIESLGYKVEYFGQKTHYGVALMYRPDLELVNLQKGWETDEEDAQRRMIIGDFITPKGNKLKVINGYFPQGENRKHEIKFPAKEKFYQDLMDYLNNHCSTEDNVAVMGDFNISPEDIDIGIGEKNAKRWLQTGKTSFLPEERAWWKTLIDWGVQDTYRKIHPDSTELYSWFDYRSRGFDDDPKRGLRIDTILATPPLYEKVLDSSVSYDVRAMEKPSDHAPAWTEFDI